jgi:hypothetical protein
MPEILGYLVALALSMLSITGFASWAKMGATNVQTAVLASQQVIIDKATAQYVQDNGTTIAGVATATVPVTIPLATLSSAGYLPAGFSTLNAFGQTWQAQVLQPVAGQLQTLVTSQGGRAITDTHQLVQIAAQSGAQGGFVPYAGQNGDATMSASNAYGAYGAWTLALTNYTNPGSGHLASLLAFTNTQANNSYLYRVQVANHPELNAMQTNLSLTDTGGTAHNISGVANVTASGALSAISGQSQAVLGTAAAGTAGTGGSLSLTSPDSNAAVSVIAKSGGAGQVLTSAGTASSSLNANGSIYASSNLQLGTGAGATPGATCTPNGEIAPNSDGSGQILSCQYGKWYPIGGRWLRYFYYVAQNGTSIPALTCPAGGTATAVVTPANFTVDTTSTVSVGVTGSSPGPWTVYIHDGSGAAIAGAQVIGETYCAY